MNIIYFVYFIYCGNMYSLYSTKGNFFPIQLLLLPILFGIFDHLFVLFRFDLSTLASRRCFIVGSISQYYMLYREYGARVRCWFLFCFCLPSVELTQTSLLFRISSSGVTHAPRSHSRTLFDIFCSGIRYVMYSLRFFFSL